MNVRIFDAVIEVVGYDLFSVSICEKVYGASGNDADEGGSETFEESPG